ncbi:MAG: metallophosphoesterase, partial [Cryomorphaceae bacterium]|nr:metallophosphoesterase [Cryomorphaceae bacterium]
MRSNLAFLIVLALSFAMDFYVYRGLKTLEPTLWIRRAFFLVHGLGYSYLLFAFFKYSPNASAEEIRRGIQTFMVWFVLLYVPKLPMIALWSAEDLLRGGYALLGSNGWPERRKALSWIAVGLGTIPFLGILDGWQFGRSRYRTKQHTAFIPGLPEAFRGFRIVQISDIHSGSFTDPDEVQKGIDAVLEANGDAVVFTGDLVNNKADEIDPWLARFAKIQAPFGVYSILGNHDYGDYIPWPSPEEKAANLEQLVGQHAKLGWDLLRNERRLLRKDGAELELLGIENWGLPPFPQYGRLADTLALCPDPSTPKILMSHDPSHFDAEVLPNSANIALTLSGHTHGMQFGIEIPGWFKWSPVKWKYPRWNGAYPVGRKTLYVNRGFG